MATSHEAHMRYPQIVFAYDRKISELWLSGINFFESDHLESKDGVFLSSKFKRHFFISGARYQFWPIFSKCLQIFGHGSESIKVTSWSDYRSKILANYRNTLRKSVPHYLRFELFIKKILDWCETHGQFVGLRVRRYRETDL